MTVDKKIKSDIKKSYPSISSSMQCDNIFVSESYDGLDELDELEDLVYEDCNEHCEDCLENLFNFFDFDNTMLEKFPVNLEYNANLFDIDFDECFDKYFDEDYFDDCFSNHNSGSECDRILEEHAIRCAHPSYDEEQPTPKSSVSVKYDEAIWARDNYETFNNYELQYFINGIEQLIVFHEKMYEYTENVIDEDIDSLAELRKIKRLLIHKQNLIMGLAFKQAAINFRKMKTSIKKAPLPTARAGTLVKKPVTLDLSKPVRSGELTRQALQPIKLPVFTNAFFESFKL